MNRIMTVTPLWFWGVVMLLAGGALPADARAQDAPPPPPPAEHVFAAKFDEVWDMTQTYLKTRPNPIPIASAEKEGDSGKPPKKGVISSSPHRYFKIVSAAFPPRQQDFRDTYTITVTPLPKGPPPPNPPIPGVPPLPADKPVDLTKVQVERKFEKFDKKAKAWVDADQKVEKAGVSADDIFLGVQYLLTPPPPPPPIEE
ncbi:MAG: hypothetical protein ACOYXU_12420 [Nitrospirota bacterium]